MARACSVDQCSGMSKKAIVVTSCVRRVGGSGAAPGNEETSGLGAGRNATGSGPEQAACLDDMVGIDEVGVGVMGAVQGLQGQVIGGA